MALGFGAARFVDLDHKRLEAAEVGPVDLVLDTIGGEHTGRLRPHVGGTYSIPEAAHAFAAKRRGLPGKAVLTT